MLSDQNNVTPIDISIIYHLVDLHFCIQKRPPYPYKRDESLVIRVATLVAYIYIKYKPLKSCNVGIRLILLLFPTSSSGMDSKTIVMSSHQPLTL
ncbi:hypothetical protein H477_5777 [[Clostridium] sordellii ATCC 9714]|nr:hypothetical protein H477_5777 [[Clostridium] sordellii ATCC 9714] [Paeniclostridium sordellii ATCC 9714]